MSSVQRILLRPGERFMAFQEQRIRQALYVPGTRSACQPEKSTAPNQWTYVNSRGRKKRRRYIWTDDTHAAMLARMKKAREARRRLSDEEILAIRKLRATHTFAQCEDVARQFKCSRQAVRDIWNGRSWGHVVEVA